MTGTEAPPEKPSEISLRRLGKWLLVVIGAGVVLYAAVAAYLGLTLGDGEDKGPYPLIENRTGQTVEIFQEDPFGERSFVLEVPPSGSAQLPSHCAAATYVAVTPDGEEVGRRPDTGECNLDRWVIGPS